MKISFKTSNANGITFNGTSYANNATGSYNCGTYNISGTFPSGYEFNSWSVSGSGSIASTSTLATTATISGATTITLSGKISRLYLYNYGDENTSVTGGYTAYTYISYGFATKNSDNLHYGTTNCRATDVAVGGFISNNKVDLTGYSKVYATWSVSCVYNGPSNYNTAVGGLNAIAITGATAVNLIQRDNSVFNTTTESEDISDLSGEYYIRISAWGANSTLYALWLEP